jgi:hypothetical protein
LESIENSKEFAEWMAKTLAMSKHDAGSLLENKQAFHFLIAWSLFETRCFETRLAFNKLKGFSNMVADRHPLVSELLSCHALHFHNRYKNGSLLKGLTNTDNQALRDLTNLVKKPFDRLCPSEIVFLVVAVVYRFRNNMFHGNKSVDTWWQYGEEMKLCIHSMQVLVSDDCKLGTVG